MDARIGIVGGVGPFAGLDLQQKILANSIAHRDQDHLSVLAISAPAEIVDRTEFLLGQIDINPAEALAAQLRQLEQLGATVAGIPCNTAHAAPIFGRMMEILQAAGSRTRCLHMIAEVGDFIAARLSGVRRVGVLSTTGTYRAGFYPRILAEMGLEIVVPEGGEQETAVHPAIYDPEYGIKALGRATSRARADLLAVIDNLRAAGAGAIILGCTELPLAFPERELAGLPLLDPTDILARALIREAAPEKLRPWPGKDS